MYLLDIKHLTKFINLFINWIFINLKANVESKVRKSYKIFYLCIVIAEGKL